MKSRKQECIEGKVSLARDISVQAGDEVYIAVWNEEEERFIIDARDLEVESYEDALLGSSIPESLETIKLVRRRELK